MVVLIMTSVICSCRTKIREIRYSDHIEKGNISISKDDTVYDGLIECLSLDRKVITLITYSNNQEEGKYVDYYKNGNVCQSLNYARGLKSGIMKFYDSTGKLYFRTNYYYGIEMGPLLEINDEKQKKFRFVNFEGLELYRCVYDSDYYNKAPQESGNLLNYVTRYIRIDGELKLSVFLYLIAPPHKYLTYKLFDKDTISGDSSLIISCKADTVFFRNMELDMPSQGHVYLWSVEAFYPNNNISVHDVLNENERKLKMPGSRSD